MRIQIRGFGAILNLDSGRGMEKHNASAVSYYRQSLHLAHS